MSIPVALPELRAATERFAFAYLLTVSDNGRAHVVAVMPEWASDDGTLSIGNLGRRTAANTTARPGLSLLWPPASAADYTLIVDGDALVTDDGLIFTPTNAVLHHPAAPAAPE